MVLRKLGIRQLGLRYSENSTDLILGFGDHSNT